MAPYRQLKRSSNGVGYDLATVRALQAANQQPWPSGEVSFVAPAPIHAPFAVDETSSLTAPVENSAQNAAQDSAPYRGVRHAESAIQTWEAWLTSAPTERRWTVEGVLPESGLAVLIGRGKQGKSTLAVHLCRSVAVGEPFLGMPTQQRPVLYVNYEMADDYLASLMEGKEISRDAYLTCRPKPVFQVGTITSMMMKVEQLSGRPGLMVVDSFRGAFRVSGEGENSAGVTGVLLRKVQDLAILRGWVVLIVHHRSKGRHYSGADGASGTSDWIAAPDVVWTWSRENIQKPGTLEFEGRILPVDPLSVTVDPSKCLLVGATQESSQQPEANPFLTILDEGPTTAEAIAERLGIPGSTARKRLLELAQEGLVEHSGSGVKGKPRMWKRTNSA